MQTGITVSSLDSTLGLPNEIKNNRDLTCALQCSGMTAIISEKNQHGLLALVVVAPRSKADQFQIHLTPSQSSNHHLEPQVVPFIHHPGADLQGINSSVFTVSNFY